MELIFRICLFISGVINFVPSVLAFLPNKISTSYGIEIPDSNFELLLRHRAILFGIVGGIMIYAAISKRHYNLATLIGFVSMISFLILYGLITGEINAELKKVMTMDVVGIVVLLIGVVLYRFNLKRGSNSSLPN